MCILYMYVVHSTTCIVVPMAMEEFSAFPHQVMDPIPSPSVTPRMFGPANVLTTKLVLTYVYYIYIYIIYICSY